MIDHLLSERGARELADRLRPGGDVEETLARVSWNVLTEPEDTVAGILIAELGAADALRAAALIPGRQSSMPESGGVGKSAQRNRVFAAARRRWFPRSDPRAALRAMEDALHISAQLLLPGDREWPEQLAVLGENAPIALWVRGDPEALCRRGVSIVGARASTSYGEHIAAEFAGELAASGELIVSGGAYGIDGVAHRAALGVGGKTIAYLAGGIDRLYPSGHQRLFEKIMSEAAVVSELPCGATPTRWRFLSRKSQLDAFTDRGSYLPQGRGERQCQKRRLPTSIVPSRASARGLHGRQGCPCGVPLR